MRIRIDYAQSAVRVDGRVARSKPCGSTSPQLGIGLSNNYVYYLSHYFNEFLRRNVVNPKTKGLTDVVSLMKNKVPFGFVHHAVLSVGAMQAFKLNASEGIDSSKAYSLAVGHYSKAVTGLRQTLDQFDQQPSSLHCVLWTTHLLGLFEVSRISSMPSFVLAN